MDRLPRTATLRPASREVVFPLLAALAIVSYSDIHIPMGLPGHRGLVWLTLLVAVVLVTHRTVTVVAVGAAASVATLALNFPAGAAAAVGSTRYFTAAVLLYAVAAAPMVRRRRWLIVLAAAPIHLVALADSLAALLGRGNLPAFAGVAEKVLFHLGFGLAAGILGWAIASALTGPRRW